MSDSVPTDPRVTAVVKRLQRERLYLDGTLYQWVAEGVLAAADAVDPLRGPDGAFAKMEAAFTARNVEVRRLRERETALRAALADVLECICEDDKMLGFDREYIADMHRTLTGDV